MGASWQEESKLQAWWKWKEPEGDGKGQAMVERASEATDERAQSWPPPHPAPHLTGALVLWLVLAHGPHVRLGVGNV